MLMDGRRTDGVTGILLAHPWAFSSDELKSPPLEAHLLHYNVFTFISGYHGGSELFLVFDEKTYLYTPSDTTLKLVSHYTLWCSVIGPGTR